MTNIKPKNNFLQKRKVKTQINEVIKANTSFNEFLEMLNEKYPFDTQDQENVTQLQTHLINLNVHFVDVIKTIK